MTTYKEYRKTVSTVHNSLTQDIYQLASAQFEKEEGIKPEQVLPDKTTTDKCFQFEVFNFRGDLYPHERQLYNIQYKNNSVTTNQIASNPSQFTGVAEDLYEAWESLIGDPNPLHSPAGVDPGPSLEKEVLSRILTQLEEQCQLITADPTLDDFIHLIKDKNYQLAGELLNIDFNDLLSPGGGHELSSLFTNGEIHIVYRDTEIALLKPEYNHDVKLEMARQRASRVDTVRLEGEIPELGFVVGRDDTPMGLFAHSVDATRLNPNQTVSREYIHNVMGFDKSIEKDAVIIDEPEGERIRLQGDLAVECLEKKTETTDTTDKNRCNLPIDNHLVLLKNGVLPEGETRDIEPITVEVPERTPLNVNHDEHDPVATGIMPGRYRFYLLPRGLQTQRNRPNWPEPK
jgi:hypothetical protein